jgi:hypothetical protein
MASYIRSQSLINTLINVQEGSTMVPAGLYKGVGHTGTPSPPSTLRKNYGHQAMKNNILIIMNCILFFILKPRFCAGQWETVAARLAQWEAGISSLAALLAELKIYH